MINFETTGFQDINEVSCFKNSAEAKAALRARRQKENEERTRKAEEKFSRNTNRKQETPKPLLFDQNAVHKVSPHFFSPEKRLAAQKTRNERHSLENSGSSSACLDC